MYLVCSTKSGRLVVIWRVYNTTAAAQERNRHMMTVGGFAVRRSKKHHQTIWGSTTMRQKLQQVVPD